MRMLVLTPLLALAIAPAIAEEQIYKWEGETSTHYSDKPPARETATQAETVDLEEQPVSVIETEGYYKWMDADGKVRYGPKPPAGVQAEAVEEPRDQPAPPPQAGSQEAPAPSAKTLQGSAQEAPLDTTPREEKIYTWRDAQGRMHVSTQPPPGQQQKN